MRADAYAKVNLSLRVRPPDRSGMHPLRSLAHSIDWFDVVELCDADDDRFELEGDDGIPSDATNLAVRALDALRKTVPTRAPVHLRVGKQIPAAAGLGGGSADAAAVLALASHRFGVPLGVAAALAGELGADVPFCLTGGAAWMEGYGELLTPIPPSADFVLAVVVPPFELATSEVYRRWDVLDGPSGTPVEARFLPDSLREHAPLANDLEPAAAALAPDLADWSADLAARWGTTVLMSGSGPSLFGFFSTHREAEEAASAAPGARAARACRPVPAGRREADSG